MEIIVQEKFYQAVVESAVTALVVFDCNGQVKLANSAIREMFGISTLHNINQLQRVSSRLTGILQDLKPGESKTINVLVNGDAVHLSIAAVCINIRHEEVKLVALHDISRDLDRQEIESWQKLIRILNHEIMNSVAPITSLSSTLSGFFIREGKVIEPGSVTAKTITDTIKGLSVIENHGKGLINFVESYRNLTKLPKPVLKEVSVSDPVRKGFYAFCLADAGKQ
ncbi:MAG: PAS domain-containing protein [Bacteroidales bacterium]